MGRSNKPPTSASQVLLRIVSFVTCRGEEGREISVFLLVLLLIDGPDWTMKNPAT